MESWDIHQKTWATVPGAIFGASGMKGTVEVLMGFKLQTTLKAKCLYNLFSWFSQTPVTSSELFLDFVCSLVDL